MTFESCCLGMLALLAFLAALVLYLQSKED